MVKSFIALLYTYHYVLAIYVYEKRQLTSPSSHYIKNKNETISIHQAMNDHGYTNPWSTNLATSRGESSQAHTLTKP